MPEFYLELDCRVVGMTAERFEALFEPVTVALTTLKGVIDPDLAANLDDRVFTFSMSIDAPDQVEALAVGQSAMRTAIHATGGNTPGWENGFEMLRTSITGEHAALTQ